MVKLYKFLIVPLLAIFLFAACTSQKATTVNYQTAKQEITAMMLQQAKDWSNGDLEAFMQGYIKSDSLKFVGSSGLTYGWQQTLDNYKKGYPTKDHTGTLTFKLRDFDQLANDVFLVIGEFHLKRKVGDANGMFSIILKRINGEWKIIADHSS
ncbi:nuclear transport factor 2 family protein [Aureibaculum sp. 2210JD6-5]|uniref:YybH family protein n=1 Tax=Aureibaculum sp. 2210JD6-5 TaxID=3103957 RepID=UPI002AAC7847|nr:nuclear transport factor 2 family protein [Aureibaculum sp. 2210JD6-5]MDY7396480.1 nuclear transport factor 2 family protein [Aureibaculum sp. 2210JD6-5]